MNMDEFTPLASPAVVEKISIRAYLAVVEERIACYGVFGNDELRRTWLHIRDSVMTGKKLPSDSQAADLFAKVYMQMVLPPDLYERIFLDHFTRG